MNVKKITSTINIISYIVFSVLCYRMAGQIAFGIFASAFVLVYFLFVLLSGSVKITISKMVATRFKRGFIENAKKVFKYSFFYTLIISVLFMIISFSFHAKITGIIYKDSFSGAVLAILSIFFLFLSISENIKGYYYGCGGSFVLVIADIIKDLLLIFASPFIVMNIDNYGAKVAALKNASIVNGVYGAIGISVSILIAYFVLTFILIIGMGSLIKQDSFSFNEVRSKDGLNAFVRSFTPAAVKIMREIIFPVLPFFVCTIFYLKKNFVLGGPKEDVYTIYSYVSILVILVISLIGKLFDDYCDLQYVILRTDFKKDDRKAVISDYTHFIKSALVTIVPLSISLLCFSEFICNKILNCNDSSAIKICVICSFALLFSLIDKVLTTSLQAVNLELGVVIGNITAFVLNLIFLIAMSKNNLKISAVAVSILLYYLIALIVHVVIAYRNIEFKINDVISKFIKVCIASVPTIIIDIILSKFLSFNILFGTISLLIGLLIFYIVLFVLGGMSQRDINNMQGSFVYNLFYILGSIFHVK